MDTNLASPILEVLDLLARAYPERQPASRTLDLYLENLADIPPWLLRAAADQHIHSSPWFPKISDLRRLCARIARTERFESLPRAPVDYLGARLVELEEAFFAEGCLDEDEWQKLAKELDAAERPHRAEQARLKLANLQRTAAERDI